MPPPGEPGLRRGRHTGGHAGDRHTRTVALFGAGVARPADNRTAIIEFLVADVDAEYARAGETVDEFVNEPTTMPWGNRSLLFRDPDGNLVNFFTPVTPEAVAKLGRSEDAAAGAHVE